MINNFKSEREFYDTGGFVSESTKENRRQILAMDALFMETEQEDNQSEQQEEDKTHEHF